MKKKTLACLLLIGVTFCSIASTPYAGENQSSIGELTLEEVIGNEQIQEEINTYLNSKLDSSVITMSAQAVNLTGVQKNQINRAEGFQSFEKRGALEFTNVEIASTIKEILAQSEEELTLQVYEWTSISYLASFEAEVEDVMGYGVYHEMTFTLNNGEYELVNDSFDERFITGVCSTDYATAVEVNEPEPCLVEEMLSADLEKAAVMAVSTTYDVNAAINYANQYCGIISRDYSNDDGIPVSGNNPGAYNPAYTYYPDADCANFISQCLYSGGLTKDSAWKTYTREWINARALADYLTNTKGFSSYPVSTEGTNIYPGNPVYWINQKASSPSGHQMICTGYNSSGVPVLNGHNSDMFRVPYDTLIDNAANYGDVLKTIYIVNSDQHEHESSSGTSYSQTLHSIKCNHCRKDVKVSHTFRYYYNSSTHWQNCTLCGYTKTPTSHNCSYSSDSTYHWRACTSCGYSETKYAHSWTHIYGTVYQCSTCGRTK